jgi:hypothetical protein
MKNATITGDKCDLCPRQPSIWRTRFRVARPSVPALMALSGRFAAHDGPRNVRRDRETWTRSRHAKGADVGPATGGGWGNFMIVDRWFTALAVLSGIGSTILVAVVVFSF